MTVQINIAVHDGMNSTGPEKKSMDILCITAYLTYACMSLGMTVATTDKVALYIYACAAL